MKMIIWSKVMVVKFSHKNTHGTVISKVIEYMYMDKKEKREYNHPIQFLKLNYPKKGSKLRVCLKPLIIKHRNIFFFCNQRNVKP